MNRGVLTGADMAGWRAGWEDPLTLDYAGLTIAKCGAWSQGPVLLQQLALLLLNLGALCRHVLLH
jgi:gamma-glutamyltranspeptidase/glutathione hydrolase